jgi:hypothetical protein
MAGSGEPENETTPPIPHIVSVASLAHYLTLSVGRAGPLLTAEASSLNANRLDERTKERLRDIGYM